MPHFTKKTILSTLSLLAERLTEDHRHADIYIFGGAGLVLDGLRTVTADIDVAVREPEQKLLLNLYVRAMSEEPGQQHLLERMDDNDYHWLHIEVGLLDLMIVKAKDFFRPLQGFDHTPQNGGLNVSLLNPATQLVMKLMRVNLKQNDLPDMQRLCQRLGCSSSDELYQLWLDHQPFFPKLYTNDIQRDRIDALWTAITTHGKKKTPSSPVQTCRT